MNRAILVKSCRQFRNRQTACLSTWAADLIQRDVTLWFAEGGSDKSKWCGARMMLNCRDDYRNNSIKLLCAINWLLRESEFDMLFICDDDTFVHPQRWLDHEPSGEFECRLHWPKQGGETWAHGGSGWYMSRRLCELYGKQITIKRTSADDVLATFMARRNGAEIIDRPDLYGGDEYAQLLDRVAEENEFITSHHVQPDEMRKLYDDTVTRWQPN